MAHEDLVASSVAAGFEEGWVKVVLDKFGPDGLKLAQDAMQHGLSKEFVVECLEVLGKDVLDLAVQFAKYKLQVGADPLLEAEVGGVQNLFLQLILQQLIKALPALVEKFGPQLGQMLTDLLSKFLQSNALGHPVANGMPS
jgi:hypothetical protein